MKIGPGLGIRFRPLMLACLATTLVSVSISQALNANKQLSFPLQSIGRLSIVEPADQASCEEPHFVRSFPAQGNLLVPMSANLILELNFNAVQNPSLLDCSGLKAVNRIRCNQVELTSRAFQKFSQCEHLQSIQAQNSDVNDVALSGIEHFKELALLDLCGSRITSVSIAQIARCSNLEVLRLDDLHLNDSSLGALSQLKKLKTLTLHRSGITNSGIERLKSLSQLQVLHIGANRQIDNKSLEYISSLKNLQSIDLRETTITLPGCLKFLVKLPKLTSVIFAPKDVSIANEAAFKKWLPHCKLIRSKVGEDTYPLELFAPLR